MTVHIRRGAHQPDAIALLLPQAQMTTTERFYRQVDIEEKRKAIEAHPPQSRRLLYAGVLVMAIASTSASASSPTSELAHAPTAGAGERSATCQFVRLDADGAIVLRIDGVVTRMFLFGLEISTPVPSGYATIVGRLSRSRRPLRCLVRDAASSPVRAQLFYFAWRDKTGEVWEDLALSLVREGVARVALHDFPERAEYLRHQRP